MPRALGLLLVVVGGLVGCLEREPSDQRDASSGDGSTAPSDGGWRLEDGGLDDDAGSSPDAAVLPDGGGRPAPVRWFEDVSAPLGWSREPLEGTRSFADRMSGGVCVLDVDGRAPVDLFFTARGSGRSRLFVGDGPLRWVDRTEAHGLQEVGDAMGCLAFDADGDGDDDLAVSLVGGLELYLREGDRFENRLDLLDATLDPLGMYTSMAAGDVDGDGDLDLLMAGFLRRDPSLDPALACLGGMPCTADIGRHAAIANLLLIRQPDGRYVDRAAELAPALALPEATLVVAIGDFLEEGQPALYVGNDLGGVFVNRVLRRQADGTFRDVGRAAGFATNARGYGMDTMGLASGDLDRDGRLEHAVTSFENDATAIFDCEAPALCEDRGGLLGMRVTQSSFRWGAAFLDVDLDGWVDLVEATGHYYLQAEIERGPFRGAERQRPNLLRNLGGERLEPVTPLDPTDALGLALPARGLARTDLDDDGRPDVVLATTEGPPALLHNVARARGRWLRVVLEGRAPNTRGVGAHVRVETARGVQLAEQRAGEGYLGSFDPRLFFGLDREASAATVVVRWPSGRESRIDGARVDRELVVREP